MRIIIVFITLIGLSTCLQCYNCGVFLSAESSECRGSPTNTSCIPDNIGCIKITGENADGTFYVEKRCADKKEERDEGCIEIGFRGIKATECMCKTDFCNGASLPSFVFISFIGFYYML